LVPLALLALAAAGCHKARVVSPPSPMDSVRNPNSRPPSRPVPPPPPGSTEARDAEVTKAITADLGNVIHFDYNEDAIKPEDRPILDRKAAILAANPALRIRVSGHADERGSDEYNLVLGNKRALAAKRYLESKGVNGSRIEITSFGEERPVDPSSNEAAWAKNRRAEFEILAGGDRLVPPK
jgi:peptidoglycan-associated lipoprotein